MKEYVELWYIPSYPPTKCGSKKIDVELCLSFVERYLVFKVREIIPNIGHFIIAPLDCTVYYLLVIIVSRLASTLTVPPLFASVLEYLLVTYKSPCINCPNLYRPLIVYPSRVVKPIMQTLFRTYDILKVFPSCPLFCFIRQNPTWFDFHPTLPHCDAPSAPILWRTGVLILESSIKFYFVLCYTILYVIGCFFVTIFFMFFLFLILSYVILYYM
jgi:hypothetical protein